MMARTIAYHAYHSLSIAITSYYHLPPPPKKSPAHTSCGRGTKKQAAPYSPALHCSTIGADGLNFSVRNGKRWDTAATATKNNE